MGQLRFPFRFNRYTFSVLLLFLVIVMYAGFNRLQTQTTDAQFQHTTLAPDAVQKQVIEAVGVLPGIDEVFVNQLADGTYMVQTTATIEDISQNVSQNDGIQAANSLAVQFMSKVYGLPLHITAVEIYIQQNDRLVMGMGVGKDHKDLFASVPVNAGSEQTKQVLAVLQRYQNQDTQHPDRMAWVEHVSPPVKEDAPANEQ